MGEVGVGPVGAGGGAGEWDEATLPVDEVRSLFVTLAKAFRAYQLYDENNPVRQRFVDSLRGEFRTLWDEVDRLVVSVEEDVIRLGNEPVYSSETRNDSLAFLFFKDGIRQVTFRPGIEDGELERFLGVLQRARKLVPEGDDLLTVLWEENLQFLEYQYVDFLAEGVTLPEPGPGASAGVLQAALEAEDEEIAAEEAAAGGGAEGGDAPRTVRQDDFNPTLYVLDAREMEQLRAELQKELDRDIRADVLRALMDRLEESGRRDRQTEILGILRSLLPNFLSRGGLVAATNVLAELRRLEGLGNVFDEERLAQSRLILDEISSPRAIEELIQALFDGTIRASATQLGAFLEFLRGGALAPLLTALETVEHRELKGVLRTAVKGIAARNQPALVALLEGDDPVVVAAAARLAGDVQVQDAGAKLARLLGHFDPAVRLAAIEAAVALKASVIAAPLQSTLHDPERDVRIAAARALGRLRYSPAAAALGEIVTGRAIRQADITEKVAFFEAYGLTAQAAGVSLLADLLGRKGGLLGKKEPSEIRAAAALGLGRIDDPRAREALEAAAHDDDPVVRSNVGRALRQEGA